jgi:hypothetical protein
MDVMPETMQVCHILTSGCAVRLKVVTFAEGKVLMCGGLNVSGMDIAAVHKIDFSFFKWHSESSLIVFSHARATHW